VLNPRFPEIDHPRALPVRDTFIGPARCEGAGPSNDGPVYDHYALARWNDETGLMFQEAVIRYGAPVHCRWSVRSKCRVDARSATNDPRSDCPYGVFGSISINTLEFAFSNGLKLTEEFTDHETHGWGYYRGRMEIAATPERDAFVDFVMLAGKRWGPAYENVWSWFPVHSEPSADGSEQKVMYDKGSGCGNDPSFQGGAIVMHGGSAIAIEMIVDAFF
jgi:hypothetical protein